MDSSPRKWRHEANSREMVTLIETAFRAARFNERDGVLKRLDTIRERVRVPSLLEAALQSSALVELTRLCFSDSDIAVRESALYIFLDGLYGFESQEIAGESIGTITTVLKVIQAEVLNVAVRSDLFRSAFEGLGGWCLSGKTHRDVFLEVFPIEQLMEYDVFHFPSDVLEAYVELIRIILARGKSKSPLFGPVLKIYQKLLAFDGHKCRYPGILCDSIREALPEFENEDPLEELMESSFIESLVRHTMERETCKRYCYLPIMQLIVQCLVDCNKNCQWLIDQGILGAMKVCLNSDDNRVYKCICVALATVFGSSFDSIASALRNNLIGPLFFFRKMSEAEVREAARDALLQFFARATSKQIFTLFEHHHLGSIVELLHSTETSVQFDGLRWLFALVSATRAHAPHDLPKVHQKMIDLNVKSACEKLVDQEKTEVCSLARGLLNLLDTTFD